MPWTPQEDKLIFALHAEHGNKWTLMAAQLQGRPANAIKNHWNSTLKRSLDDEGPDRRKRKRHIESALSVNEAQLSETPPPKRLRMVAPRMRSSVETSPTSPLSTIMSDEHDHVEIYPSPTTFFDEQELEQKTLFAANMVDTPVTLPEPHTNTHIGLNARTRSATPTPSSFFTSDDSAKKLDDARASFVCTDTCKASTDDSCIFESHPRFEVEERMLDDYEALVQMYHPSRRQYAFSAHGHSCHVDYSNIQINEYAACSGVSLSLLVDTSLMSSSTPHPLTPFD